MRPKNDLTDERLLADEAAFFRGYDVLGKKVGGIDREGLGHGQDRRLVDADIHEVLDRTLGRHEILANTDLHGQGVGQACARTVDLEDILGAEQALPVGRGLPVLTGEGQQRDEREVVLLADHGDDLGEGQGLGDLDFELPCLGNRNALVRELVTDDDDVSLDALLGEALGLGLEGQEEEEVQVPALVMGEGTRSSAHRDLRELLVHPDVGLEVSDLECSEAIVDVGEACEQDLRREVALRTQAQQHVEQVSGAPLGHLAMALLGRTRDVETEGDGPRIPTLLGHQRVAHLLEVEERVPLGRLVDHARRGIGRGRGLGLPDGLSIERPLCGLIFFGHFLSLFLFPFQGS